MGQDRIEDIIPPSRRKKAAESEGVPVETTYEPQEGKKGSPLIILIVIIIIALLGGLGAALLFSGAKVVVHPLEREVPVNTTFTTSTDELSALPFETVRIEKVATQSVPADGSETVSERASGVVTVYNEFSSSPQRWVTNTRFEAPNGLIFRVKEPVDIPGMEDGQPGTVDVTIYADGTGAEYNVGLVDFTIPGLEGSPQFESMYAKAKTPLSGGFEGERPVVSEEAASGKRAEMRTALTADLNETIKDQIPAGFTLLENSVAVIFDSLANAESEQAGSATIREQGTALALVFPTDKLAEAIAIETIAIYDGNPVTIGELNSLSVSNLPNLGELQTAEELNLAISGSVDIVWKVSADQIKTEIAGKTRAAAETVLSNIPGIDRAELILRPFWKGSFPNDSEKITVSISTQ